MCNAWSDHPQSSTISSAQVCRGGGGGHHVDDACSINLPLGEKCTAKSAQVLYYGSGQKGCLAVPAAADGSKAHPLVTPRVL